MEYPKIETLFNRDLKTFKVMTDQFRCPEFAFIKSWAVTEKVDGTNIRVMWDAEKHLVTFGGRTDNAQMPVHLLAYLQSTFTPESFATFDKNVILFGEGYGEKIQKGGGNYRKGVSFRLFDVFIEGWWLEIDGISEIADALHIQTVPRIGWIPEVPRSRADLEAIVGLHSQVANEEGGAGCLPEGIVARSFPLLFNRRGQRVMWKLKFRDF